MLFLVPTAAALADPLWIELTQGDLSNDRLLPTPLIATPGDNELFGLINGDDGQGNIDRDYFSVTIPSGFQLSELVLDTYASDDFAAFIAIQPGAVFPNDPDTVRPEDLMGWTLFGPSEISHDLLPQMSSYGYGFARPLPAGIYSFWVQQTGDFTDWTGIFVVTPAPEPSVAIWLLAAGFVHTALRRARRDRTS